MSLDDPAALAAAYRNGKTFRQLATDCRVDSSRVRLAVLNHLGPEAYQRLLRDRREVNGSFGGSQRRVPRVLRTKEPDAAEMALALAAARQADLDRLAAQPVRSKTARAKVEARAARKRALHPLISEAVLAATGADAAESWNEED